jgi:4-methylaminobutanoate oxidase (formaldehyde-forming)
LRQSARAVVIGGGVAGASIAYHLARLGWSEILLIERHDLTEGTTWHSAGFVGQLRSTVNQTRIIMYSAELYAELRERTGLDPGWNGVGGLRLATTAERVAELRRQSSTAQTYGLDMRLWSAEEIAQRVPGLDVTGVLLGGWLPGDGYLRPEPLVRALVAGATALGVEVATHTTVTGVTVERGRVTGVVTDHGTVRADVVVNAAGAAAGWVGRLAGVDIPVVPIKHQYAVSTPLPAIDTLAPTVRDPDHLVYFRPDASGGLLVGGYLRHPEVCWPRQGPPLATPRTLFPPDDARFAEAWTNARMRVPQLREARIARVVHGPEAFTPDGEFLLGETAVAGFFVAAGFCVHGLAAAGGVGRVLAEWIVDGTPSLDLSTMDIRRFGGHAASRSWATARALDAYSTYYDIAYPHQERTAARPLRRSPTWPRLAEFGAVLGEKAGWERVNWFASNLAGFGDSHAARPHGWAGRVWSSAIESECRATAEVAGLFDQSSFAKFSVRGPAAARFLDRLCAGEVDRAPGTVTYTQLLNARAGIEADLTVTRLAESHFRVVTSTASGVRDLAWLRRHAPEGVEIEDITGGYGCLCLWGPVARDILAPLADEPLDFGFLRAKQLTVGHVPVLAQRVTFVGEAGYELYPPAEYTLTLWDALLHAGLPVGMRPGGYRAIEAMRLEKSYRVWGSDITPETTPDEAGLGFAVRTGKDFLGRDALLAARAAGPPARRLRCLVLADPAQVCLGTEPIRVDGRPVGRVTSGGVGYRVGASLAYGYLPSTVDIGARVEVGMFGEWQSATVVPDSPYDPTHSRIRTRASS